MTGFVSKRQAAQGKLDDDDDTQVYADRKRGSIALARELCVQIAGYTDDDQDQCGHDYGSVDIAEILSAEVERLREALAQPEQQAEPVQEQKYEKRIAPYSTTLSMLLNTAPPQQQAEQVDCPRCGHVCSQRPWAGLTEEEVRFYTEKHRALVNAHYDKVADTNIITEAFDSTAFYKDVSAVLKERNT